MRRQSGCYNPKRRIADPAEFPPERRRELAKSVSYGGNGEHKLRPADYGLEPPRNPRPMKALCDANGPFPKAKALKLLRTGVERGMVSAQRRRDWPQNIWAVQDGVAFEAQLENPDQGTYHGYPMTVDDDFRTTVLQRWANP